MLIGAVIYKFYEDPNLLKTEMDHGQKFIPLEKKQEAISKKPAQKNIQVKRKTVYKKSEASLSPAPANDSKSIRTMVPVKRQDLVYQLDNGDVIVEYVELDNKNLIAHGDIIVGDYDKIADYQDGKEPLIMPFPKTWPKGIIPYSFASNFPMKDEVLNAIELINTQTNVKFVEKKSNDRDYVEFEYLQGRCISNVGYLTGKQKIALSDGCTTGKILHEMMHTLGFFHEQNRASSRNFLKVLWENIDEKNWVQFKVIPRQLITDEDYPFSLKTLMIYPSYAFSKYEGDFTIVTVDGEEIENRYENLTRIDIERINKLYPKDK